MRFLYTILFYFALPYIFLRLWLRSRRLPAYRQRLSERLGYCPFALKHCIWIHAVSVGESVAAVPLIKSLQSRYPDMPVLVTTMTPTGAATIKTALGERVFHAYLPYDVPQAIKRFLNRVHPVILIIMETELWPNLLAYTSQRKVPVCLVNARLSLQSANGYRWAASLTRAMLGQIDKIAAQGENDAERFISLGASPAQVVVTGNIKFDLECPPGLKENGRVLRDGLGRDRFVWIAASTHEGEERIALEAHQRLREKRADALLILVPRHPDRFEKAAKECERLFETGRRSQTSSCPASTAVYLGDTMGELLLLYQAADAAFVGGSLIKKGGHNLLEPAILAKPILSGPSLFNFADMRDLFLSADALRIVDNASTLSDALAQLMDSQLQREEMGKRAFSLVANNKGALEKQVRVICELM